MLSKLIIDNLLWFSCTRDPPSLSYCQSDSDRYQSCVWYWFWWWTGADISHGGDEHAGECHVCQQVSAHWEYLEYYGSINKNISRSRDVPSFWATNLPPGEKVYIRVYASNTKGRSSPILLQAETSLAAGVRKYLLFLFFMCHDPSGLWG